MNDRLILSLFPGIGLLDMAFERAGFCVVRGPDVIWGGDVRDFTPPAGAFGGVIGGPPCQTFSALANLVRARGYEPRFGNLIPEFERCVSEAAPRWFLMENVPKAPEPRVAGYAVHSFILDNAGLPGERTENGVFGQEQMRARRFSFGVRGDASVDLRRWIELALWRLPYVRQAALSDPRPVPVPVKLGGSGKPKTTLQKNAAMSPANRVLKPAVTGAHSGEKRPKGGHLTTYRLPEACRLQGLPEDFLAESPLTAQGKLKAVANGVPLPMGTALAGAIVKWLGMLGVEIQRDSE